MEQQPAFNAINHDLTIFGGENTTNFTVAVAAYACPSDPDSGRPRPIPAGVLLPRTPDPASGPFQMIFTSYAGCSGSYDVNAIPRPAGGCVVDGRLIAQSDGVFSDVAPISMASITDGLSQTLFVTERATVNLRSLAAIDPRFYQERGWWIPGNRGATIMTTFYPPGMPTKVARAAGGTHASAASSTHPGGFSALLGDGSVRFIKDTIATWPFGAATGRPIGAERASGGWWRNMPLPSVWQALGTRAGGEVIESDF